jgi:hypothetical protein
LRLFKPAILAAALALGPAAAPPPGPVTVGSDGISLAAHKAQPRATIRFGASRTRTLAALRFLGTAKAGSSTDCDGGPLSWAAYARGITVYFEDGRFAGWWVDDKAVGIATARGIRPGSTRAQLAKAHKVEIFESSLGHEFSAGGFYGLLDDRKPPRVASLYAGRVCTAR